MDQPLANEQRAKVEQFREKHRTALFTLVFTDLVGSTKLKQDLGDSKAVTLIQQHHGLVRQLLRDFPEAEEIETAGDSFLIVFVRPSDAVKFCLLLHAGLRAMAPATGCPLTDRAGIHFGEVIVHEGADATKLFGTQVDTCGRLVALAQGGQTLLTRFAFDNARQILRDEDLGGVSELKWLSHGPYLLKGLEEPVEICEVGEARVAPLSPPPSTEKAHRHVSADAEPVLGWRPAIGQAVPHTKWLLEQKLGEGGFGEVWLGRHQTMKERRVFKFCFRADRVRSLKREMTLFRLLKERVGEHPNIVALREVYFDEPPFYVEMDHVEGQDLKAWCEQQGGVEKVPLAARLEIMAQIADALQAAHDAGVIHRDVKPGNILVRRSSRREEAHSSKSESEIESEPPHVDCYEVQAKLTDFGIGQVVSEEALKGVTKAGFTQTIVAESSSSQTGSQMYMAPELLAGKPASIRSDIYSLGVVLYQLLVGDLTRPLTTDWVDHISDPLLRDDLKHCFAGNPQDRFAGAGQLAKHLRALPERQAALARQQAALAAAAKAAYRRGIVRTAVAAAVIIVAVTILAVSAVQQRNRARAEEFNNRRLRYAAEVNLAQHALADGKIDRALELLEAQRPKPGDPDMRGFEWRFLRQFCHDDALFTLYGHESLPQSITVSPDGKWLASADNDTEFVHVWDVAARRKAIPSLSMGRRGIRSVVFSRDGKVLAAGGGGGLIRLWNTTTWQEMATLEDAGAVERVAISPDGRIVAAATRGDERAKLWSWETKQVLATFTGTGYTRACVAFSPDGRWLAFGQADNSISLVDLKTWKEVGTLSGHRNVVTYLDFSPDAKTLATAGSDATVKLWDVTARREIGALVGHKAHVASVAFSPDGRTLATSCSDATIKLWDFDSRQELATLRGHGRWVNNAVFFPDGKMLASGSDDATVKFWNSQPKGQDLILGGDRNVITSLDTSSDGKLIATATRDGMVTLWDVASQNVRGILRAAFGTNVECVFSQNGQALLTRSDDGKVKLWDVASLKELFTLSGLDGAVRQAVFSSDGRQIATLSEGKTVKLFEAATGKELGTHQGEGFRFIVPVPDGRILVASRVENTVRFWDVSSQQILVTLKEVNNLSDLSSFSPDGKHIAGRENEKLILWDMATGDRVFQRSGHTEHLNNCTFSHDSRLLVTTSRDNTAKLWDVAGRREIATLRGHSGWVESASFSPDGKTLATACNDGTAKLWSLASHRELLTLPGHVSVFSTVTFTPDGNALVCKGENGLVRLWRAPTLAEIEAEEAKEKPQVQRP